MFKMLTNEEFLQKLKDIGVKHIPLEEYKGSTTKIKWMCFNNSKHIFEATPDSVYRNTKNNVDGCMYCSHQKVFIGETDMWTTRPDMASMLENSDDGYKYFAHSNKKVNFICPNCGFCIKEKLIRDVDLYGLSCPNCSDGMSFGEKFVYKLLSQLKCVFIHDKTTVWSEGKRYDFHIPNMCLIIEVHGLQHYKESFERYNSNRKTRTVFEETENDNYKKNLALNNGIKHYIQLDCRKSDFNYIKNSILSSELKDLFDLSIIDWDECFKSTLTSNVIICANLWNSGMKNTKDISDYTGIDISSVIPYLKRAAKIGLCDYIKNYKKNKNRYKKVLCIETEKIYEYIGEVKIDGYDRANISRCCNHKCETAYGMHWKFI